MKYILYLSLNDPLPAGGVGGGGQAAGAARGAASAAALRPGGSGTPRGDRAGGRDRS